MAVMARFTVVFDLDDTLIASARARRRAYRSLSGYGIDPRAAEAASARWWTEYYQGRCSLEEVRHNRWLDLGLSPTLAQEVDERFRRHHANIRPRTGARRLLERLRAADVALVLLSNSGVDYMRERARALRAEHLLDGIVDIAETRWKPDAAAFRYALDLVGGIPRRAAMVGDTLDTDVEGALAAGFGSVVWLTRRKAHPDPRVVCVRSLQAVEAHLLERVAVDTESTDKVDAC
jgi:putative hydrolase of the HAD superfamily